MKKRRIFFTATIWITIGLIIFRIFQIGFRVYGIVLIRTNTTEIQRIEKINLLNKGFVMETKASYFLFVAWIICFLIWFYTSYKIAQQHSKQYFSFKPVVASFAYLIPIFNLFAPYRIMQEIWSAENRDPLQEDAGRKLINVWWFLSLLLAGYSRYLEYQFQSVKDVTGWLYAECYFIVFYAVCIHYFFVLRKLLKMIDTEQNYRRTSAE